MPRLATRSGLALQDERAGPHAGPVAVEGHATCVDLRLGRLAGAHLGQRVHGVGHDDRAAGLALELLARALGELPGLDRDLAVRFLELDGRGEHALHVAHERSEVGRVATCLAAEDAGERLALVVAVVVVEDERGGEVAAGPRALEGGGEDRLGAGEADAVARAALDVEREDARALAAGRLLTERARARRVAATELGAGAGDRVRHLVPQCSRCYGRTDSTTARAIRQGALPSPDRDHARARARNGAFAARDPGRDRR